MLFIISTAEISILFTPDLKLLESKNNEEVAGIFELSCIIILAIELTWSFPLIISTPLILVILDKSILL